jgi:glycosyltransferase involved in cell wall biosynthesis
MRIFFDAEDFKTRPRGIVKTTLRLYEACQSLMPELSIVGITRKPIATELPAGIGTVRLKPNLPRVVWRSVMYNAYLAFHDCTALHFPSNGLIPPLATGRGIPVVMTLHDIVQLMLPGHFPDEAKREQFIRRRQRDIERSRIVFTDSLCSKRDIVNTFRIRSEPVVLPLAPTIEPETYDPVIDIGKTGAYFLYNGGYDRRKGLDHLLRVFMGLHREKKIASTLYFAGSRSYYSEGFKRLVDEATEMRVLKELDYVSDRDLVALMRNAKGLIYPSFYEGFGLPPLEAMHIGCPVITTPYSSIPEVCGDAALYVRPEDAREFGDAIIALERNGPLRSRLIEAGKAQAGRFSWSRSASLFLSHVTGLRDGGGS